MDYRQRRFQSKASERLTPPAGVLSAAASGWLAARDGMNHQDFVLVDCVGGYSLFAETESGQTSTRTIHVLLPIPIDG